MITVEIRFKKTWIIQRNSKNVTTKEFLKKTFKKNILLTKNSIYSLFKIGNPNYIWTITNGNNQRISLHDEIPNHIIITCTPYMEFLKQEHDIEKTKETKKQIKPTTEVETIEIEKPKKKEKPKLPNKITKPIKKVVKKIKQIITTPKVKNNPTPKPTISKSINTIKKIIKEIKKKEKPIIKIFKIKPPKKVSIKPQIKKEPPLESAITKVEVQPKIISKTKPQPKKERKSIITEPINKKVPTKVKNDEKKESIPKTPLPIKPTIKKEEKKQTIKLKKKEKNKVIKNKTSKPKPKIQEPNIENKEINTQSKPKPKKISTPKPLNQKIDTSKTSIEEPSTTINIPTTKYPSKTTNKIVEEQSKEMQPQPIEQPKLPFTYTVYSPMGDILYTMTKELEIETSALNFLLETNLPVNYNGSFVEGLNNVNNSDTHAWIYEVNGKSLMISANEYKIQPGDNITWKYIDFTKFIDLTPIEEKTEEQTIKEMDNEKTLTFKKDTHIKD